MENIGRNNVVNNSSSEPWPEVLVSIAAASGEPSIDLRLTPPAEPASSPPPVLPNASPMGSNGGT